MWPVTRIAFLMTMTTRSAAAPTCSGDRSGPKIFQFRNLPQDCDALLLQFVKRFSHEEPPVTERPDTLGNMAPKKNPPNPHFYVAHPTGPVRINAFALT